MARHDSLTFQLDLYVELSVYDEDLLFQILLGTKQFMYISMKEEIKK